MRFFQLQNAVLGLSLMAVTGFVANSTAPLALGQSAVTGAVSGAVSDATGGVVPNATVIVTDTATNAKQIVKTNAEGRYTVGLLKPGLYKVTAAAESLKSDTLEVNVILGTTVPGDIKVTPTGSNTVIEVTSTSLPLLDTQNVALATTFSEEQIQDLPSPGGDVTTVAFTAPGVVVNAGGSYGNFSSDGLPGISNLFVLNGFDNQDPFLNLNNSGSSNLTLGQGELAEATVVQNAYNSQYGRAAGAIISYTTKSGGNRFHGEADYNYNGSALNANGWFNKHDEVESGDPNIAPHAVSNEWAVNVGGPIIKDKVFFFADYEGLRYVLPSSSGFLTFPTPQLATYIENTVPAAAQGTYAQALASFTKSPAYASSIPVTNGPAGNQDGTGNLGCGSTDQVDPSSPLTYGGLTGTTAPDGGVFGVTEPCMTVGTASVNNVNKEWLFTGRADWNINDKHKIYGRYKMDRGSQPTSTSSIDPLYSAISIQPEYEGQFNDSYVISPTKTNVFVAAANWYTAYFGPVDPAASIAELPINFYASDAGVDSSGVNSAPGLPSLGVPFYLTQGRNVTQYQIEDDFNWIHGKHTIKIGGNFRRDLVSDYDAQENVIFPYTVQYSLGDFASGLINGPSYFGQNQYNSYNQSYAAQTTAHLALYNLGAYVQDEFQALPNLKLTMGVRIDRTGNPLCHGGCFSTYDGTFPQTGTSYNSVIDATNNHPFPNVDKFDFQPRFGFNYGIGSHTEIRGGAGIFSDLYPAAFIDGIIQNFPNVYAATAYSGSIAEAGAGSAGSFTSAQNTAVQSGFLSGASPQTIAQNLYFEGIAQTGSPYPFTPPNVNAYISNKLKTPEYVEFSLQLQHQLSKSDAIILTYAGNYGYDGILQNGLQNASSGTYVDDANGGSWQSAGDFAGLPSTPADPRFSQITTYTNDGHSNYSGGMVSYKHDGHGLTGQLSYTYSHALDMISNGGVGEPFNTGSLSGQGTPSIIGGGLNYSNSDYDIRHNLVGDLVYEEPFKSSHFAVNEVLGGWVVGAKTYYRGGEPYSITNNEATGSFHTLGAIVSPDLAPGVRVGNITNPTGSNPHSCVDTACLDVTQFGVYSSQADFGDLRRNAVYGSHYVNTDISLLKKLVKTEGMTLQIGANAYNIFNHVNFGQPNGDIGSSSFGQITTSVAPPTSPYGSFQGAAVTQRLLQVHGKITF